MSAVGTPPGDWETAALTAVRCAGRPPAPHRDRVDFGSWRRRGGRGGPGFSAPAASGVPGRPPGRGARGGSWGGGGRGGRTVRLRPPESRSRVGTPPPPPPPLPRRVAQRAGRRGWAPSAAPPSITWPERHKNNRFGRGRDIRGGSPGPWHSPRPMEDTFLESFGRLSLQQPQPRPPAPPPPRGTPARRPSFRKHLYLLRGLPGSGKTTLAR